MPGAGALGIAAGVLVEDAPGQLDVVGELLRVTSRILTIRFEHVPSAVPDTGPTASAAPKKIRWSRRPPQ
jgi:hypothetical protein